MPEVNIEALIQAKIIMLALGQRKRGVPMEAASVIVRAAVGNLINFSLNENNGDHERFGSRPVARYMSRNFYQKWKENPYQFFLSKVGVYEHRTPMKVLEQQLIQAKNEMEILKIVKENAFCVWITHEENKSLNAFKLRSSMPEAGDRYSMAGIELEPSGPIVFVRRNSKMARENRA